MTEFKPITPEHGKVFYNGEQIGIYKNFAWSKEVSLEIGYTKLTVGYEKKHLIKRIALKIHLLQQERIKKRIIKQHKLRNSIYNTKQPFTYGKETNNR
jgi:hypothetical protein